MWCQFACSEHYLLWNFIDMTGKNTLFITFLVLTKIGETGELYGYEAKQKKTIIITQKVLHVYQRITTIFTPQFSSKLRVLWNNKIKLYHCITLHTKSKASNFLEWEPVITVLFFLIDRHNFFEEMWFGEEDWNAPGWEGRFVPSLGWLGGPHNSFGKTESWAGNPAIK